MFTIYKKKESIVYMLLSLIFIISFVHYKNTLTNEESYLNSINLAGTYLLEHIDENGKYIYEYNPVTDEFSDDYNILRHAGTTYSLLEIYEVTKDENILKGAEKALEYLVNTIEQCPNYSEAGCIVEKEEIKLGGNGLAILAMAKHSQVTGSDKYLSYAQNLALFITHTQSEDGEFAIHKINSVDGSIYDFVSAYYPGEAIFALARLYKEDGNEQWIESAHKGALWLIEVRDRSKNSNELPHDHWLLYALNELHEHNGDEKYVQHTKKISDAMINYQNRNFTGYREEWNGGYGQPPNATSTASRSEGLSAAFQTLNRADEKDYALQVRDTIKNGIDFQLRNQITEEKVNEFNLNERSLGAFHHSLDDFSIRIDYVQHNISAILGYMKIKDINL